MIVDAAGKVDAEMTAEEGRPKEEAVEAGREEKP